MKNLILIALMVTSVTFGQIGQAESVKASEVIGIADKGVGLPRLEVVPSDNLYMLSFYNLEYPSLREIETLSFYADKEDLNYLYEVFKTQLGSKEEKTITLGDNELLIKKQMGSIRVMVLRHDAWFYLSKKQLDRLFDKA